MKSPVKEVDDYIKVVSPSRDNNNNDDDDDDGYDDNVVEINDNDSVAEDVVSVSDNTNSTTGDDVVDDDDDDAHWKRSIQVGPEYQAEIPDLISKTCADVSATCTAGKLLWSPYPLKSLTVDGYCKNIEEMMRFKTSCAVESDVSNNTCRRVKSSPLSSASVVKDSEQSLYKLMQCNYNSDEALRRIKNDFYLPADTVALWSDEEKMNFTHGIRQYGKDFFIIQQQKLRSRSVSELVNFYYLWKKSDEYKHYMSRTSLRDRERRRAELPTLGCLRECDTVSEIDAVSVTSSLPYEHDAGSYVPDHGSCKHKRGSGGSSSQVIVIDSSQGDADTAIDFTPAPLNRSPTWHQLTSEHCDRINYLLEPIESSADQLQPDKDYLVELDETSSVQSSMDCLLDPVVTGSGEKTGSYWKPGYEKGVGNSEMSSMFYGPQEYKNRLCCDSNITVSNESCLTGDCVFINKASDLSPLRFPVCSQFPTHSPRGRYFSAYPDNLLHCLDNQQGYGTETSYLSADNIKLQGICGNVGNSAAMCRVSPSRSPTRRQSNCRSNCQLHRQSRSYCQLQCEPHWQQQPHQHLKHSKHSPPNDKLYQAHQLEPTSKRFKASTD